MSLEIERQMARYMPVWIPASAIGTPKYRSIKWRWLMYLRAYVAEAQRTVFGQDIWEYTDKNKQEDK